ncbi:uncharacterized protein [Musca autumnalis]|uniref:uncharacterized protein n=1 Tax=Musca autumnalis TaxID=221902 RepID=UPI003CEB032E
MRTITIVFLFCLVISDILLGVPCMPVTSVGTLLRHFKFGEYFCNLIQVSQGYLKCRENYALPYKRPCNIFLDLGLPVLPLVILSVAYTLITSTLYVLMRIEKVMIFGGGADAAGSETSNCNVKLNCDELYSTVHAKYGDGSSYTMTTAINNINKGAYLSTTMATTTSTSSMTTLASTSSSAMSRLRFQFSL